MAPTNVGGRVPAGEQVARENMSLAENTMGRDNSRFKRRSENIPAVTEHSPLEAASLIGRI
jgi:hypothetical protein